MAACSSAAPDDTASSAGPSAEQTSITESFEELESRYDARLGVHAVDTGTGEEVTWREDERFAYASTIKALAAGAVLDEVGVAGLETEVLVEEEDIVPHSPVTENHIGQTLTLREIAEAAVTVSDNAAANYLFDELGGPDELDAALEDLGDDVTEVVRREPELNEATPGDDRDTTTARAITGSLREYLFGTVLDDEEKSQLGEWLIDSETGATLIRANLPSDWTIGDRSGAGGYGTRGNIAAIWPTSGDPIVISVLSSRDEPDAEHDDQLIAEAAELAISQLHQE
ncbi:class A beta-lactamase [Nesterenkonia sp. Hz 6-5]|nr:class A beta-lactamase [Nesterenkonia haasae]